MASDVPSFPIFLQLAGTSCLVVGGHRAAYDKVAGLLAAKANVTVVANDVDRRLDDFSVTVALRPYRAGEAGEYGLVIAATGIAAVDHAVAADAKRAGVLVNVVDDRSASTFIMPAIFRKGDLTVAVSTNGNSPAFATFIRDEIGRVVGDGIDELLEVVAEVRNHLKSRGESSEGRDWRGLIDVTVASYRNDGIAGSTIGRTRLHEELVSGKRSALQSLKKIASTGLCVESE